MMYFQSIDQAKERLGVDLDGWLDASLGIPAGQAGIDLLLFLPPLSFFFFLLSLFVVILLALVGTVHQLAIR